GLTADSRQVAPGFLFAALSGRHADGHLFIDQALERGAAAILDDGSWAPDPAVANRVCRFIHPEPRRGLSWLAAAFYGHPARTMQTVGITGTNGKTTVAAMVESILSVSGKRVGVMGTTGNRWPGVQQATSMTTPDPITLQSLLGEMQGSGCTAMVMEVSSHALDQSRTASIFFDVGAFLNLTRDHLDYHGTEEAYFTAKSRLFQAGQCARSVINMHDPRAPVLLEQCRRGDIPVATFAGEMGETGDFQARDVAMTWQGSRFRMVTPAGEVTVDLPVPGDFNVTNALAAAAIAWQLSISPALIQTGLARFTPPPGRMQRIDGGQPFAVVVDFAHTPDALERLLRTARRITPGRLLLLFGCGGDRDKLKRPMMGRVAACLADMTIVTDDNPRNEDPAVIRQAILTGIAEIGGKHTCLEMGDRAMAIAHAFTLASAGDTVLLAGKGHETGQSVAGRVLPFSDVEVSKNQLNFWRRT
ncbi:MAG: UDP-N-acetylmuramoyl-L-alanyl-D-glutamate--2,6-diaminopimelate ligase, partial [Magnetococcales bacterium]|nr:UDP-N-acetylmuramoyl-L-alanyl-D-glutamate--2,6-diaminopimelate ligase [Magnetococcales bacterium]